MAFDRSTKLTIEYTGYDAYDFTPMTRDTNAYTFSIICPTYTGYTLSIQSLYNINNKISKNIQSTYTINNVLASTQCTYAINNTITKSVQSTYKIKLINLTIQPDATAGKDTWIDKSNPDTNHGTSGQIAFCPSGAYQNHTWRGLIQFDVSTLIGNDETTTATLKLYNSTLGNPSGFTIRFHAITSSWDESTATWNNQPSYESGTYVEKTITATGWHEINITSLVNRWINGNLTNNGILIKFADESIAANSEWFRSSDTTEKPILYLSWEDNSITVTTNGTYNIKNSLSKQIQATYNINNILYKLIQSTYNVNNLITKDTHSYYSIFSPYLLLINAVYNINNSVSSNEIQANYTILNYIIKQVYGKYRLIKIPTSKYHFTANVNKNKSFIAQTRRKESNYL